MKTTRLQLEQEKTCFPSEPQTISLHAPPCFRIRRITNITTVYYKHKLNCRRYNESIKQQFITK